MNHLTCSAELIDPLRQKGPLLQARTRINHFGPELTVKDTRDTTRNSYRLNLIISIMQYKGWKESLVTQNSLLKTNRNLILYQHAIEERSMTMVEKGK